MATPVQIREINEDKMHQFLRKVVGDFGASLSSSLAYIGQKLGLYKAWRPTALSRPPSWRKRRAPTNVTCASGSLIKLRAAMWNTTQQAAVTH